MTDSTGQPLKVGDECDFTDPYPDCDITPRGGRVTVRRIGPGDTVVVDDGDPANPDIDENGNEFLARVPPSSLTARLSPARPDGRRADPTDEKEPAQ